MNALDPRCHTALGRALCTLLHAEAPSPHERSASHEFLRPPRGPHNALECRILAGATVLLAALIVSHFLHALPLFWRVALSLPAAPILLQFIALTGILVTRLLPARRRPAAISHFLLGTLGAGAFLLLASPWTRWPAAAWILLCLLNLACAASERLGSPHST